MGVGQGGESGQFSGCRTTVWIVTDAAPTPAENWEDRERGLTYSIGREALRKEL